MNENYKRNVRKMDLAGLEQREERRDIVRELIQKRDEANAKYMPAPAVRRIDPRTLISDPALLFFLRANRDPSST